MTKKDLERRNKYLLLQLKIIHELTEKYLKEDDDERIRINACISYHSNADKIKEDISFIENCDIEFNFHNKTMNIKDYE